MTEAIAERHRRHRWEIVLSIVCGVLVLGGVVGEYEFGSKLSDTAGSPQQIADKEVAELNKEAAEATKAAANAMGEAARANERAAKAEENLGNAKRDAATASERAAEAGKQAEDERVARLKIEAQLAPRRVFIEQEKIMKSQLLRLKKWDVILFVISGSLETADFASDLERVFRNAGLTVEVRPGITFGGNQRGLSASAGKNRSADVKVVAEALKAAGLITEPLPVTPTDAQPDVIQLTVAPK